MKHLFSIALVFITCSCYSQTLRMDSTSVMLRGHEQRLNMIQMNLERFDQQYSTGTILLCSGLFVSLVGVGVGYYYPDPDNGQKVGGVTIAVGSLVALTGAIIQIDSHKYIKKAARH